MPPRLVLALVSALWTGAPHLRAHGDDQMLIEALTGELAKAPDPDLYIRRGELYRHQEEWVKAEADFIAAGKLEPTLTIVDFFRARTLLESGQPARARPLAERYVSRTPDEPEGQFLLGDIFAALGEHDASAAAYAEGIRRAPRPRPEHYLRYARLLAGAPKADAARVLAALDEGIARLGPVISLVDFAITLEVDRKNYSGALERIAALLPHAPRPESWLVRQADILVQCGRKEEAIGSYRAALAAIDNLPERYRDTVPMEALARQARDALGRLSAHRGTAETSAAQPQPE
ncbi:MAG: tetratricopeptide repeat protein [Opitutaceae bacterium]|nr:tetratricopeptide repeat protein [Opitutaceae bacterium]